jgi:hypothetical protein
MRVKRPRSVRAHSLASQRNITNTTLTESMMTGLKINEEELKDAEMSSCESRRDSLEKIKK